MVGQSWILFFKDLVNNCFIFILSFIFFLNLTLSLTLIFLVSFPYQEKNYSLILALKNDVVKVATATILNLLFLKL